jgi:hypothetical protein
MHVVHNATHNDHPREATSLLRKPTRLQSTVDLELVSAAMASYGGSGVARSLYYYRTGEVLNYSMIRHLKKISHNNSTMERGSAAQELIEELRLYFTLALFVQHMSSNNFVYDKSDTSLDFIAVYNTSNNFTQSVSLLQRTGVDEFVPEEPLATIAALEIQSTRASMSIEGKCF